MFLGRPRPLGLTCFAVLTSGMVAQLEYIYWHRRPAPPLFATPGETPLRPEAPHPALSAPENLLKNNLRNAKFGVRCRTVADGACSHPDRRLRACDLPGPFFGHHIVKCFTHMEVRMTSLEVPKPIQNFNPRNLNGHWRNRIVVSNSPDPRVVSVKWWKSSARHQPACDVTYATFVTCSMS
jgi:hypothetical protein